MGRFSVIALMVLGLTACQFEPLFDGSSLSGWREIGAASWSVKDGEIMASGGGDGYIATERDYSDFRLSLEFLVDATTNSGVFVRCKDPQQIDPNSCYENNIWDDHPKPEARTGAIVMHVMPPLEHVDTIGQWSRYEVIANGAELSVRVNGKVTAVMLNADPAPGFIALQHFGEGTVRFRNIRLEPIR